MPLIPATEIKIGQSVCVSPPYVFCEVRELHMSATHVYVSHMAGTTRFRVDQHVDVMP